MPNVTPTNLIFEQSAHCDWDWQLTNDAYYTTGFFQWGQSSVRQILNDGVADVQTYLGQTPPYIYTFCEVAYLRLYVTEDPSRIATLKALQGNFTVSSHGARRRASECVDGAVHRRLLQQPRLRADGPIVKQVTVTFSITDPNNSANTQLFTQTYTLIGGENMLRMETTGAAPSGQLNSSQGYTIMAAFPFNITIASLTFGTPYHWDTRAPRNYYTDWPPSTAQQISFEPTHEFVIANDSSANALFAIDHFSTVAWGIDPGGVLLGCILRNAPGSGNGASGYDEATHSVTECESTIANSGLLRERATR